MSKMETLHYRRAAVRVGGPAISAIDPFRSPPHRYGRAGGQDDVFGFGGVLRRARRMFAAASILLTALFPTAHAADAPLALTWAALIPAEKPQTRAPKPFFAGATPTAPGPSDPIAGGHTQQVPTGDGKWMSGVSKGPANMLPAPVVAELNGKRVKLGGYVVALDFDATKVTEFLLVPFVGACIHVPPPPANQIVYVKSAKGITLKGQFDPVYVTGVLSTEGQFTGLADTGYSLAAEVVDAKSE
jgi:uncharacterized protein